MLLLFVIASPSLCARVMPGASPSFNVVGYGAKGDGHTDDSNVCMCFFLLVSCFFFMQLYIIILN